MANAWLPVGFERLERTQGEPRVSSGSPAAMLLEWAGDIRDIQTIPAILALSHRWMPMLRAKRAIEAVVADKRAFVLVPRVESLAALVADLARAGIKGSTAGSGDIDVRGTRERLGLTQEQFALRFGLDLAALRNWEHGRRKPDTAAQSYLRAISGNPRAVEAALWTQPDAASRAPLADVD